MWWSDFYRGKETTRVVSRNHCASLYPPGLQGSRSDLLQLRTWPGVHCINKKKIIAIVNRASSSAENQK